MTGRTIRLVLPALTLAAAGVLLAARNMAASSPGVDPPSAVKSETPELDSKSDLTVAGWTEAGLTPPPISKIQ